MRGWVLAIAGLVLFAPLPSLGQTTALRIAQASNTTIGLLAGVAGSTDAQAAADMADILDDGTTLRVLPIQGSGSLQNLADLMYQHGVDVAIVHADTLGRNDLPRDSNLRYIASLFPEEIHILARKEITSFSELTGKPVDTGRPGSDSETTAARLFFAQHIRPSIQNDGGARALDRLRLGEIAAAVFIGGQPMPLLQTIGPATGLHFLSIPLTADLLDDYLPARLDHKAYPYLVPVDRPVETLSCAAVLVTLSAPPGSARLKRVNRFVDAFFLHINQFRQPGHHPKWREVNLAVKVSGLTRYRESAALLVRPHPAGTQEPQFHAFLRTREDRRGD